MSLPTAPAIRGPTTPRREPRKPPLINRALWRWRSFLLCLFLVLYSSVSRLRAVLWRLRRLCCEGVSRTVPESTLCEHSATALKSPASPKPLAKMRRACTGPTLDNRHNRSACFLTAGVRPVLDLVLRQVVFLLLFLVFFLLAIALPTMAGIHLRRVIRLSQLINVVFRRRRMPGESLSPETACFWCGSHRACPDWSPWPDRNGVLSTRRPCRPLSDALALWGTLVWTGAPPGTRPWDSWKASCKCNWDWWSCDVVICRRHSLPDRRWMCRSDVTFWWTIPWRHQHGWLEGRPLWAKCQVWSLGPVSVRLWSTWQDSRPLWPSSRRLSILVREQSNVER